MAVSLRRRVILMAWRAQGKSSRLTWAAFRVRVSVRPCPVSRAVLPAGTCRQGSALIRACSSGWFFLHHGDVVAFLLACQPVQVRPHRMQGIEGHHGAVQVKGFQERGEVAGLVVLDVDLKVIQEVPAVFGDTEEVNPGAIGAACSAAGLAVHGYCP